MKCGTTGWLSMTCLGLGLLGCGESRSVAVKGQKLSSSAAQTGTLSPKPSSLCIAVGGVDADGAPIVQSACDGSALQSWTLSSPNGDGQYTVSNGQTGKCLDVNGGVPDNGLAMQQWTCYAGDINQVWTLQDLGGGYSALKNVASGKCLDLRDGNTSSGAPLQQWDCVQNDNQSFRIGSTAPPPVASGPALGLYEFGSCNCKPEQGPAAIDAVQSWLNTPVLYGEEFLPNGDGDWGNWTAPGWMLPGWTNWKQEHPGRVLLLTTSFGATTDMAAGANGDLDSHWKALAQGLVDAGLQDSVIRIAHEMTGTWYWYTPVGREDQFIAYWRHAVDAMRSVQGQNFRFFFNPTPTPYYNGQLYEISLAYPGDKYVDVIGPDTYDTDYGVYPTSGNITSDMQEQAWTNRVNAPEGLNWFVGFAAQHGKTLAIGEWGVWNVGDHHGGGDDPAYVRHMQQWMKDNNVAFHVYFDVPAGDGDHKLQDFPQSRDAFKAVFGN